MPARALAIASGAIPSTAAMVVSPAGTASAIASPRWTTAEIVSSGLSAPAQASAAYSPTEWPAAAAGSSPARRRRAVRPMPTNVSAGCAFWVSRSSSSPASTSRWRRSTSALQRSQSAEISGSASNSAPIPGAWDPCPGKRKASFLVSLDYFAPGVVAAVGADGVLQARVLALRAGLQVGQVQGQVGAAAPLASLRQLYLRQSHGERTV